MRWLSLCLLFVACDAPGSGAPCVDCVPPEVAGGDVSVEVDATPETEVVLPEVTGDATPIECVDGLTRCVGELVEQCIEGHFVATQQCAGNQICSNGACMNNECTSGVSECNGEVVRTCTNGLWQTVDTCEFGCDGEACAERGSNDCGEIWRCVEEAGCYRNGSFNEACVEECKNEGTGEIAFEVQRIVDCIAGCGGEGMCQVQQCVPMLTTCRYERSGNGTCDALANCANGCFNDGCYDGCYAVASRNAQTTYMQWANCQQLVCGGSPGCPDCQVYESTCLFEER